MKKVVAIAVLCIFLVNTMGYFVVFKCNQFMVKKEMFSQIRMGIFHPGVVLLKISHPEKERQFRRVEKNEFTYYGKLYDVVVERKSGDTTLFYCLHDKKEETLLADFTIYLNRYDHSGSSTKTNPIPALLHNLITQALLQKTASPLSGQGISLIFPTSQTPITPVYLDHFEPPPELA